MQGFHCFTFHSFPFFKVLYIIPTSFKATKLCMPENALSVSIMCSMVPCSKFDVGGFLLIDGLCQEKCYSFF